jgi:hypothetical protein
MGGNSSKPVPKKASPPPISDIDRAMLDLKNARDRLQRYRKRLEIDEEKLVSQAKQAKNAGKTTRALGLLRLRKYKQQQAKDVEDKLLNVLTLVETIDSKQNEKQLLDAMATGKDALKKLHEETTVEAILDLMEQIQEEHAVEQEITDILQGVPELNPELEQQIEDELAAMEAELVGSTTAELPTAPITQLPTLKESVPAPSTSKPERVAVPG